MKYLELSKGDQAKLLNELISVPGWKLFCEMVEEAEIRDCQDQLEKVEHKDLATVQLLQHKIKFARAMLLLPQTFVEMVQVELSNPQDQNKGVDETDPYFNTVKEVEEADQKAMNGEVEQSEEDDLLN